MSEPCPACKVVIDGGFVQAVLPLLRSASNRFGRSLGLDLSAAEESIEFLSETVRASSEAITHGLKKNAISHDDAIEHSFSGCHRATEILAWVGALRGKDALSDAERKALTSFPGKLDQWAKEEYASTVALVSGGRSVVSGSPSTLEPNDGEG